jgi:hypothetical protein
MGLESSKLSKEERVQREASKTEVIQQRKQEIESFQQQVLSNKPGAIVEVKEMHAFLSATEKAKVQLDRSGDALVKADLVAIVLVLEPSMVNRMSKLQEMRVTDLNALIRSIIYDPHRLLRRDESEPGAQRVLLR